MKTTIKNINLRDLLENLHTSLGGTSTNVHEGTIYEKGEEIKGRKCETKRKNKEKKGERKVIE